MHKEIDFPSQLAVKAAGTSINVVNRWLSRDLWTADIGADRFTRPNKGRERAFSFPAVMQLAIAVELVKRGVEVRRGLIIGFKFTDMGKASATWGEHSKPKLLRAICRPFKTGYTWLVVSDERDEYVNDPMGTKRMGLSDAQSWVETYDDPALSFTLVDINTLFDRVCNVLDYDPRK